MELMKQMLATGMRFFLAVGAAVVILRGDLVLVNYFRSPAEAGVYAIATQASLLLQLVPNIVSTILFPRTSAAYDDEGKLTCRVTRHSVFLLTLLCMVAAPFAFVLPMVYGKAFADLPYLFLILLPGVLMLGIETVQVQHFTGMGMPRNIPVFWLTTMAINLGLNILLLPRYGAVAAAFVSTLSYGLIFASVAIFFRIRTGRTFAETFVIRGSELSALLQLRRAQPR
jgi:O-antigen/teichoic acid export membrane protein